MLFLTILFRCASEPFQKAITTHRTMSETPLPTHIDVRPKETRVDHDLKTDHMEGGPSTSQSKSYVENRSMPVQIGSQISF